MIGPAWVSFEIIYLMLAILIIAVVASAAGEILYNTLGFAPWIGISLIIALVGLLNYKGNEAIAKLETIGTIALFAAYLLFSFSVFTTKGTSIMNAFEKWDTSYQAEAPGLGILIWTGLLYVGYNLAVYPSSFFTYKKITSRKESIVAGLFSGLLMTVPWFLTYFAFLGYYPDKKILESPVPWLEILKSFHPSLIVIFGVVIGWTLVATATGMIHAFITRIETEIEQRKNAPLKKMTKALISLAALVASLLLAQVGIIDLVAKGYTLMAYAMIVVYAVPLIYYSRRLLSN
jgi:uncharacterized membrane protein YkvI